MVKSRQFTRCMGRWLMALVLVMLTSLAMRAASVEVWTSDVAGAPGSTVVIPVYITCDVDITAFMINFSTDLGVTYSNVVFSDRINPSANPGFGATNGNLIVYNPLGNNESSLDAGEGLVARIYLDIPDDADPGAYTMTLGNMQFMAVGTSGSANTIYVGDVHATLTVSGSEAYACYTPSNTTLTFYYDDQRSSRSGTTYDLNTGGNYPGWYTDGTNASVTKVVFNSSFAHARPTTTYRWFYEMTKLTTITGIEYLNTSEVTNMCYMFVSCYKLTSVDVSHFNTSKVTDMSRMFYDCKALTSLDVSSFNTSKVTDMGTMFRYCSSLTSLDVSNFNTSNVTRMGSMFSDCSSLTSLNLGNFNTSKVTSMEDIFYNCSSLTSLDVSSFNTSNVTNMFRMFYNCSSLTSLDVSCFDTENVYDMGYMFYGCSRLTSLDLSSFNTSKVTKMYNMFQNCSSLRTVYVDSGWSTAAVTNSYNMFYNCTHLVGGQGTIYNANHVDATYAHIDGGPNYPGYFSLKGPEAYACYTPSNTTLTFYYDTQRSRRTGTTYDLNEGSNYPGWYQDGTYSSVTRVVFDPSFASARPTTTYEWFFNMQNLQTITGISYLNTSDVTNMNFMFGRCESLTSLDVSGFNTSNVTNMSCMFYDCCSLTSLDLSSFSTAKVIYMPDMFNNCQALTSLDVSSFNTSKVTDMGWMFAYCYSLTNLDVSGFNTANVTNMQGMFYNCDDLTTIYVSTRWSTAAVTNSSSMFYNCTKLKGGQGTTYNANHVDKAYAHIDGGPSNPGYFTARAEPYACYTPSNTTLTFYYDTQRSSRSGTTYDLNEGYNYPDWYNDGTNASVTKVVFNSSFASARPTSTFDWFYNMQNLLSITGISNLNTSEVTNMSSMFWGCTKLTSLDVSGFNTAKVTDMSFMFYDCSSLRSLDLSSFNTAKVIYMNYMFNNCQALTSLNVSSFNTANVTDMSYMFTNCRNLTSLDVSGFNTANVTDMSRMFANCWSLTSLNLSSFNTAKVTDMSYMFYDCCDLTTIYVGSEWSTVAVTSSSDMFWHCIRLVGGQGTTFDANHVDKAYAHIDGGPSNPGYMSQFMRGDVNHDGFVNVADVTALIQIILNSMPVDLAVADLSGDNNVNVADVTALIQMILNQ